MPRVLSFQDSEALGTLLDCDPAGLRHAELPAPKPWKKKDRGTRPRTTGVRRDGDRGRRRTPAPGTTTSCLRRPAGGSPRR